MSYKDYTLKARLKGRKWIEARLHAVGASFVGVDVQTDTYFKVLNGRLKLRQGTLGSLITHYERTVEHAAERTVVHRYDRNPSQEAIDRLMSEHAQIGIVKKERSVYDFKGVRIHLDRFPDGNEFVEIEARDLEGNISDADLKSECMRIRRLLEIPEGMIMPTGYLTVEEY